MAISNMQQSRQLRAGGGIMDLEPRQGYFLGKIVKKAKRGLGKVFKSPLGRAALLATAGSYAGGLGPFAKDSTMFGGKLKNLAGAGFMRGGKDNFVRNMFLKKDEDPGGKLSYGKLGLGALGLAAVTAPYLQGEEEEEVVSDPFSITPGSISDIRTMARMRDPSLAFMPQSRYTQKNYYAANGGIARLANGGGAGQQQMMQALQAEYMKYRQNGGTMPFEQYAKMVMQQQGQTQMAADGGRIGFREGSSNPFFKLIDKISPLFVDEDGDYRSGLQKAKFALSDFIAGKGTDLRTGAEWYNKLDADTQKEIIEEKIKYRETGKLGGVPLYDEEFAGKFGIGGNYANGGRIGYANAGPVMNQEVVNEDTQEVVSNPDPIAELNMLSREVFGKPYDQLNEREQEALKEFMSKNPEEEIINRDETMVEDRVMANSGGMIDYMSSANPMARSYLMEDTDIVDMYRPGGDRQMAAEGGIMDLGGMEKDYRAEGGFVPIGGQEKADDVPARLSKNEFVFTADAVRNAGGGDIDAGAEVMERLMDNLEQGGQVSEESQGGNPAQEMFDTAQQLESRIA